MSDNNDVWESPGSGTRDKLEDKNDTGGFSEHELLDIMYNTCNNSNSGEVLASTIVQYLQNMTAQSTEQDRLAALQQLLDPENQDPLVTRETFHATMRDWIAQCSQDSTDVDGGHVSWPDSSQVPVNALDFSCPQSKAASSENHQCSCDGKDLLGTVVELKNAHHKLSEQNSSLLRTVAQCEDVNLQLTLEITELRAKLTSAQRSTGRVRSLTEELEETRRAFKEAQERVARSQTSCTKLSNEVECLKVHIRRLEDKNEKLTFERTCCEESINKLRKVNAELRAEFEETLVMLTLRDREISKKDILMDKMKNSHVENHSRIMDLQSELMRLQEHSHQVLLRYDRHCISPQSLYSRDPPNHRSLQSEMQDMQQHHRALDDVGLPSLHMHTDDIQSIIHRIKSTEIAHLLQNKFPERDSSPVETQERPFPHRQQQQASIKQQLVNVLQELELQKCVWEEKGEKVEERRRASEKEQKQSQTQIPDGKKVAVVNWWRALSTEQAKARTKETQSTQELSETQEKLQRAEKTISDMREQICHLQVSLRSALECVSEQKNSSGVCHINKGTNTLRVVADKAVGTVVRDQRDAVVTTEITGGAASLQEQAQLQLTTSRLLKTLRRMEAMVANALEKAELVRESEQRVSQVRARMESITYRVEEALGRTSATDEKLNVLEERVAEKDPNQYPGPGLSADPEPEVTGFTAESDVEPETRERTESPPLSPIIPELSEPPLMNGSTGCGSCSKEEEEHLLQESPSEQSDHNYKKSCDKASAAETPFIFPHTRSHPPLLPSMPTLPEEEEDSPEELDSSSSSPSTSVPCETRTVVMTAPTIVYPQQATIIQQDGRPMEQARPHSPRARVTRNSSGGPITTVDSTGNVIDLVKDQLPELQLSEEDRQKNLELLEQAKKVSDRFLTRRGRRSTSSLTDSPTGLSPIPTPPSSPCSSRSSSLSVAPQTAAGPSESTHISSQSAGQLLDVPSGREQTEVTTQDQEGRLLVDWKPTEKRKVSSGTLTPRFAVQKENCDPAAPKSPPAVNKADEGAGSGQSPNQAPATGVAKPVLRPPTQLAPCTAEIKTIGAFPPLMRAVSWDAVGSLNSRNGAPSFPPKAEDTFSDKPRDVLKSSGYKDLSAQPGGVPKLSKLREEHKLLRNQSIVGSKLPDLSEAAEQEKGPQSTPTSAGNTEAREKSDAMPNISDVMLRKLKLHRGLPGCAPPLSEKEVENAFVQLSLAFRNDNYTLETRLKQAERERNLTEEDTEKELEEFKGALKMTSPQWQNLEQREAYQRLTETVAVLHRLATRLSSRAEIVGAVRQEKRMNKATEVMMQYVENLKRTYEKDHAELMEFKKLANQNSNRCYGGTVDTGDDGVARSSRSMSLTLGKALPRRRVSVAVVPKFNLLNIPGQTPATAGPGPNLLTGPSPSSGPNPALGPSTGPTTGAALPVLCEANDMKVSTPTEAVQPAAECGKSVLEQESEPAKPAVNLEEIRAEIRAELKAKIEEESYNKGYQEGLKQSKVHQDEKHEEENTVEKLLESTNKDEESGRKMKTNRRMEEVLARFGRYCPKISLNRRLLWMALTLFVVMCLVISIFSFFSHYYNRREDT
ncbi:inositol 1,4,5-triphosphate receptor associated 2 [Paralichthys olivaceus]|uniref:inositol 1,4,5-triphosphate receptor associated 2 n=1 Tax=Paralichthys olivaceus TaxID=8255 RepID=UPI0037533E9C